MSGKAQLASLPASQPGAERDISPPMRLVNAYVFRQIATVTAMVAVTLTCAIWLTQSLRFIELIVNRYV